MFSGYSDLRAEDMLAAHSESRKKISPKRDALCDAILELFGEEDCIEIESIEDLCDKLGCSRTTLYRTKKELGIISKANGFGKEKSIIWTLPNNEA